MKAPAINEPVGIAILAVTGIVLYFVIKRQLTAAATAVANVNAGTPYAGAGVVGTLGNVTNQLSGGFLSDAGDQLGSWLSETFGGTSYDPNANGTTRKQVTDGSYQNDFGSLGQDGGW